VINENSTYKVGSLKFWLLCEKRLEDEVPTGQEIKVHTKFKQLMLPWEVVIGCEQKDTKHIITLCGQRGKCFLTLRLLMSYIYIYIYGAPIKARNANDVYIWIYVWQRWNSLFLFAAQCFNTESMQRGLLCHICV